MTFRKSLALSLLVTSLSLGMGATFMTPVAFAHGGHGSGCPVGTRYTCHGGNPHQPQYCECEG